MLDFDEVLARGPSKPLSDKDEDVEEGDPDRPMFSLITGKYRHAKRYGGELLEHHFLFPLTEILQKTISLLRLRHPRPLFLEIKMVQSQHSGIALLVCPFLFCATS